MKVMDRWFTTRLPDGTGTSVQIELRGDIRALAEHLGAKAIHNRTGRARAMAGRIEARVVKGKK